MISSNSSHDLVMLATKGLGLGPSLASGDRRFQLKRFADEFINPESPMTAYELTSFLLSETACFKCKLITAEKFRACEAGHQTCGR